MTHQIVDQNGLIKIDWLKVCLALTSDQFAFLAWGSTILCVHVIFKTNLDDALHNPLAACVCTFFHNFIELRVLICSLHRTECKFGASCLVWFWQS